jgi:hypothetical protein
MPRRSSLEELVGDALRWQRDPNYGAGRRGTVESRRGSPSE